MYLRITCNPRINKGIFQSKFLINTFNLDLAKKMKSKIEPRRKEKTSSGIREYKFVK